MAEWISRDLTRILQFTGGFAGASKRANKRALPVKHLDAVILKSHIDQFVFVNEDANWAIELAFFLCVPSQRS
jgi:hypothetical protein